MSHKTDMYALEKTFLKGWRSAFGLMYTSPPGGADPPHMPESNEIIRDVWVQLRPLDIYRIFTYPGVWRNQINQLPTFLCAIGVD